MEEKRITETSRESVIHVFQQGRMPTGEEYTKFWIRLINQLERERADRP